MVTVLIYLMVALALAGTILVGQMRWQGWVCWVVSDIGFFIRNLWIGEHEQAVLWAIYTLLSVWGLSTWLKRLARERECRSSRGRAI